MDINQIEKKFKGRFKFALTTHNIDTYDPIVSFVDTLDNIQYKIEMATAISLETILENIIQEKRDKKINNILS
jgi:hypothetical protein